MNRQDSVTLPARRGLKIAVLFGGICQLTAIVLLASAGTEPWRVAVIGVVFLGFSAIEHAFITSIGRGVDVESACSRTVVIAQLAQVTCMAVTGGLASPYLVAAILPAVMPLVVFGPVAVSLANIVISIALMVAVALLPVAVTGPAPPQQTFTWVAVATYASALLIVYDTILRVANTMKSSHALVESFRTKQLSAVEKRTRTLQRFRESLEDELRNPLAVIKALVQLVARDPKGERTEERLGVVQGEVARIERTIGDYLTFQRAVDSLELQDVELEAIASDAIETLGQRAHAASVTFDLMLRPVRARADLERLTDALIEVLSRAIAGAPPDSVVSIWTFPANGAAVIKISVTSSRRTAPTQPRFDATFAALVFAQHGGDLVCVPESERAVTITLSLPVEPQPRDRPRWRLD